MRLVVGLSALVLASSLQGATINFGPISVAATSAIFDPDNVLTADQLSTLTGGNGGAATAAVEALVFTAGDGQAFTFSATGLVGCCSVANVGPDGYTSSSSITSLGSISGFASPAQLPLVGVFTNGAPAGAAPPNFDYSGGLDQASFSPLLNQVFFIGDGLTGTGSGAIQTFTVPSSATELWLGFADAFSFGGNPGWYGDNPGALTVTGTLDTGAAGVPEPGTLALTAIGAIGLLLHRRTAISRKRKA